MVGETGEIHRDPVAIRPYYPPGHGIEYFPAPEVYRWQTKHLFLHLNVKTERGQRICHGSEKVPAPLVEVKTESHHEINIFSVVCLEFFLSENRKWLFSFKYHITKKLSKEIRKWEN